MQLTATRPLDCGVADSYVVQLDKDLALITAWQTTTSAIAYHGTNRYSFTQALRSDGTCAYIPTAVDPLCTQSSTIGGSLTVYYDTTTQKIVMDAVIPDGSYQGWGWGPTMTNTEIVVFSAEGASSAVTTYYGTGDTRPTL